jgi:ABC-2 type transport system ATP-binding protein
MNAIEVAGLTKRFGPRTAVDHVDLEVAEGEIVGFLGPNGSGKTTTLRMLCGLLRPDEGRGFCLGYDVIREAQKIKQEVGYMTQRFSYYDDLSIRENLSFVATLYGVGNARARIRDTLESLGLVERANQLAGTLSGGLKQRLALAASIMHDPRLLLLDEPTAGVDPKARREFWDEIHALAAKGITALVSTHYMDEAERCHRVMFVSNGRIVARGTAAEVISQSGLTTWIVNGGDAAKLIPLLRDVPGVDDVAPFGTTIHVVGSDAALLAESLGKLVREGTITTEPAETSLEDVFIRFMSASGGTAS